MEQADQEAGLLWTGRASWRQFAWLYLIGLFTAWRALLFWQVNATVGAAWLLGTVILMACAALLRSWARYEVTAAEVRIQNAFTGRSLDSIPLSRLDRVEVQQGPVARFLGIASVVARTGDGRSLRMRGLSNPEEARHAIETARRSTATDQGLLRRSGSSR